MRENIKAMTDVIPTAGTTIMEKELGYHRPTREQRSGKEITDSAAVTKHYPTPT